MPHEPYQFKFMPRDSVLRLADSMEEALRYNSHRGTWTNVSEFALLNHAQTACNELKKALNANDDTKVYHHAVTVANYMMMIADNVKGKR